MTQIYPAIVLIFTATIAESLVAGPVPAWSPLLLQDSPLSVRLACGLIVAIAIPVSYVLVMTRRDTVSPQRRWKALRRYPLVIAGAFLVGALEGSMIPAWEAWIPGGWLLAPRALALAPSIAVWIWGQRKLRSVRKHPIFDPIPGGWRIPVVVYGFFAILTGAMDIGWYFPLQKIAFESHPYAWILFLGALVFLLVLLAPRFTLLLWPVRSLPSGPLKDELERIASLARVRYRDILVWETGPGGPINACVAGVISPIRRILLTESLLAQLQPEQVSAVFAHEVSHVKRRHLWIYSGVILVAIFGLTSLEAVAHRLFGGDALAAPLVAILLGFAVLLVAIGRLSHLFEHEADLQGALLTSPYAYGKTLIDIMAETGENGRERSWRHPSLRERLAAIEDLPQSLEPLARKRARALWILGVATVSSVFAFGWVTSWAGEASLVEKEIARSQRLVQEIEVRERRPGHMGPAHRALWNEALAGLERARSAAVPRDPKFANEIDAELEELRQRAARVLP